VVELLLCKHKDLSSNPSTAKKKKSPPPSPLAVNRLEAPPPFIFISPLSLLSIEKQLAPNVVGRLRQGGHKFEVSLSYRARPV
jgi:hypothetical protein